MRLNTIKPAEGSKKDAKRVGRGMGSGSGKTAGRGHKGQKSRTGGSIRVGFEGGQMPIQRRLPKRGFSSGMSRVTAEIRLHELNKVESGDVDFKTLLDAGLINRNTLRAKVVLSGELKQEVNLKGIRATAGAKAAIEAAGGKVEE
ncbi:MAG: 50S ribosomal protein L15 [Arenicellaceae bacterium]|nr:50S ribosomal protein L15 [Arenicellaceae bacterium]